MSKKIGFILFLILFVGFLLRVYNINTWPRKGATFDEYAWTWQGMNIIQKGVPISWSPHSQYKKARSIIYQKTHFRIVEPFLEHPPLFGIVAGSFAIANGVEDMYELDLNKIRPFAVILGVISIAAIFLLVSNLYGMRMGIIASLLYAIIPTIVIGSRIVQNENFFIPLWLLSLYFVSKYISGKKIIFRNLAIIIASLLIFAKIPWVAASMSIVWIFLFYKKYYDAFLTIVGAVLALMAFGLYGYYYDWNLFINLWKLQAARYDIAFTSIFALLQKPFLIDRHYTDGWIYFGWFAFILLLIQDIKKNIFIIAPVLSYFIIFLAGIPDEAGHGWYRYPFYPFLAVSIALFFTNYFGKNYILTFFSLVIIGTTLIENTWASIFGFSYIIYRIAIISWCIVLIPLVFSTNMFAKKISSYVSYLWFGLFIFLTIISIILYNEQ